MNRLSVNKLSTRQLSVLLEEKTPWYRLAQVNKWVWWYEVGYGPICEDVPGCDFPKKRYVLSLSRNRVKSKATNSAQKFADRLRELEKIGKSTTYLSYKP